MLEEHWEAVECDWQEVYGLALAEAIYGGEAMSARRATALIIGLPPTSRSMRLIHEDPASAAWTPEMTLAGLMIERIDALHASFIKANGGKAKKPVEVVPRPKPSKRAKPAQPTLTVLDDLDKQLAAVADG